MTKRRLSEKRFETKLARLLEQRLEAAGGRVTTFRDAGVLTMNRAWWSACLTIRSSRSRFSKARATSPKGAPR